MIFIQANDRVTGVKTDCYVIEPKSLNKEELFGSLDSTTLEWTDGIFSHILRKV